jgi:endonuclease-3
MAKVIRAGKHTTRAKSAGAKAPAAAASGGRATRPSARKGGAERSSGRNPERVQAIVATLAAAYPRAECALHHRNAWELLVATILSAQCTDVRVNMVTPELFRRYPTPQDLAAAPLPAIEELIRNTGFYHNKAVSISGAAKKITTEFGGEVPRDMAALLTLPGVARKTANVVLGVAFGIADGIVVDTHVQRIAQRLDLTAEEDPKRIEQDLMAVIPRPEWIAFSHRVIAHGRQTCIARKPKCVVCPLERLCYSQDKTYWSDAAEDAAHPAAAAAKNPVNRRAG